MGEHWEHSSVGELLNRRPGVRSFDLTNFSITMTFRILFSPTFPSLPVILYPFPLPIPPDSIEEENYKFEVFHYTRLLPDLVDIIRSYHHNNYMAYIVHETDDDYDPYNWPYDPFSHDPDYIY